MSILVNTGASVATSLLHAQGKTEAGAKSGHGGFAAALQKTESPAQVFMAYQEKSIADKYREAFLAEKGLTEDDIVAMTPEERMKIEQEIAERIREKLAQSLSSSKA